jgi:phosphatidylserine decarboxylase
MNQNPATSKKVHLAAQAARRLLWRLKLVWLAGLLAGMAVFLGAGWLAWPALWLGAGWLLAAGFILFFFRDPEARIPVEAGLVVAPAHGRVDTIEENVQLDYMEKPCLRVSIFLSIFDVHVQNAPVTGTVELVTHTPGKYLNAISPASARVNENILLGIREPSGGLCAVRLIAGLIARRIVPWVRLGETVERGSRIGLIQFGSRCDLYLASHCSLLVRVGDRVKGGETPVARTTVLPSMQLIENRESPLKIPS